MFYRKTVLDNGITVMSEPMDSVRSVALGIWFSVGSRDESAAEAGMSHFMEHMMFKGTPTRSAKDISEQFDRLGAELNAFTSKEYTCYYSRFVDEHLPTAFEILADMVVSATLDDEACESEREVVIEEIARMEDTPDDRIHEIFSHALWPDHPIGLPILGSRETVGQFDHAQSVAFRDKHYLTGNCVVAAAGNVDHDELVALAERFLVDSADRPALRAPGRRRRARGAARRAREGDRAGAHLLRRRDDERAPPRPLRARDPRRRARRRHELAAVPGDSREARARLRRLLVLGALPGHRRVRGLRRHAAGATPRRSSGSSASRWSASPRAASPPRSSTACARPPRATSCSGMESTRMRMTRLGKNEVTGGEILSADEIMERFDAVTMDDIMRVSAPTCSRARRCSQSSVRSRRSSSSRSFSRLSQQRTDCRGGTER